MDDGDQVARRSARVEHAATVLLSLAAVATAWATFQAAHLRSEQALAGNRATTARIEATRTSGVADRQIVVDVQTFTQWVDAYSSGNDELTTFYSRRFRPEFRPAVTAWIATMPLQNASAPLTPFAMPEYRSAALAEADRLEEKANQATAEAQSYVKDADRYTLCVVLFASSLFFAGISTRLRETGSRAVVLGVGCALFLGALVWIVSLPVSLTV